MISRTPVLGRFFFVNVWCGMVGAVMCQGTSRALCYVQAPLRALVGCGLVITR